MTLQKIKSPDGKDEYVLLPIAVYRALREEIEDKLPNRKVARSTDDDYVPFVLADYVDNPVALARILLTYACDTPIRRASSACVMFDSILASATGLST